MAEEYKRGIDAFWDDEPIDITAEANFIWGIANKLRGTYMPDKYGDVVIPMTIIRRLECALEATKQAVIDLYKQNPTLPSQKFEKVAGFQFYCTSDYTLKKLCDEPDYLAENFKSYINGFSANVQDILKQLKLTDHIATMDEGGCLYSVVKEFSVLDLYPQTYDSIKMGYIFENLIGRFFQNVDAGQYYTGRDIIKTMVSILTSEGCDDVFEDHKVITVLDQACGTGGMLSTAYTYFKFINPSADVRLFGQEFMPVSYAVGLAEMLIKGQDARNFRHVDTFKVDCFDNKMQFVIENPPFGTPWSGKDAKEGQEEAVRTEYAKALRGEHSRWEAGLPSGGDSQMIFIQSALDKLDDNVGRAAIVENGAPLFTGGTASGESQIRRWLLEKDYIEAIIALPTELFYNTGIQTYVWILSKNKSPKRRGKIQLIDATSICHKLRKPLGYKKYEFDKHDRKRITQLYVDFQPSELVQIFDNEDFLYREYTVMQPLQRSYAITGERIENMIAKGSLSSIYDEGKVYEWENSLEPLDDKTKKKLREYQENKPTYDAILQALRDNISDKVYFKPADFLPVISKILAEYGKKVIEKVMDGLSVMDKNAEIQRDRKGNIIYDKETADTEIVPWKVNINDYMQREVLPYIPDAVAFFEGIDENATIEQDRGQKKIKIGAEIPFTRYFYKYQEPKSSEELAQQFSDLEDEVRNKINSLLGGLK